MTPELAMAGGIKIKPSQLEKGELNVLKSIGKYSEHSPETRPLFTNASGKRLYRDNEIETMGGVKALEKMTPEELKSKDLKRYEMPTIRLSSYGNSFRAFIPDHVAMLNGEILEKGVVDISLVYKGLLPDGVGAHFLADTLKACDAIPTKKFIASIITNPETLEAFAKGLPAEQSLLGRHMIKALKECGLEAQSAEFVKIGRTLRLVIDTKR